MQNLLLLTALLIAFSCVTAQMPGPGWESLGDAPFDAKVMVSFAVKLQNKDKLRAKVDSVSNPRHPDYTNYWTFEQVKSLTAPSQVSIEAIGHFLEGHGIFSYQLTPMNDFIRIAMTIEEIERVFNVDMLSYKSTIDDTNFVIHRTLDMLKIDSSIESHIDAIFGLRSFPIVRQSMRRNINSVVNNSKIGDSWVAPHTLKHSYNITDVYSGSGNSSQALAEWQYQNYASNDLANFLYTFNLPSQTIRNVYGKNNDEKPGVEANLDVQYIIATGTGVPTDFYIHDGFEFDVIAWTTKALSLKDGPLVWSVSYGESVDTVLPEEAHRLDTEFQKFAVMGISVLIASGDSGVYDRDQIGPYFHPSYPALCPHATAVGATFLNDDQTETQATEWSGGGYSPGRYFKREADATYQIDACNYYYYNSSVELPPQNYYDRFGRAIPDVSALGENYSIFDHGQQVSVSGTSCSTPAFAGIISLLNDQRSLVGKKPLGFLNPFLYQNQQAFNDILLGKNSNGKTYGFSAAKYWDPISGLGTPNYTALKQAALLAP